MANCTRGLICHRDYQPCRGGRSEQCGNEGSEA
jgi:hypothetical protein